MLFGVGLLSFVVRSVLIVVGRSLFVCLLCCALRVDCRLSLVVCRLLLVCLLCVVWFVCVVFCL